MDVLIWFGIFFAFTIMVIWPLFDEWFKDLEDEVNREGWYSYIDNKGKKDD
jgi:hypothetical protein